MDDSNEHFVHKTAPQVEASSLDEGVNEQSPGDPAASLQETLAPNVLDELEAAVPIHDPSWMYDSLLNLMLVLMAAICYLLLQKYQELMEELREIRKTSLDPS
jgi:hypothetical protein